MIVWCTTFLPTSCFLLSVAVGKWKNKNDQATIHAVKRSTQQQQKKRVEACARVFSLFFPNWKKLPTRHFFLNTTAAVVVATISLSDVYLVTVTNDDYSSKTGHFDKARKKKEVWWFNSWVRLTEPLFDCAQYSFLLCSHHIHTHMAPCALSALWVIRKRHTHTHTDSSILCTLDTVFVYSTHEISTCDSD